MSYSMDYPIPVDQAPADVRAAFIRRTYGHLAGAVLLFIALTAGLLQLPGIGNVVGAMFSSQISWLLVLGGFMVVSWVATSWAYSNTSPLLQYLGLGLYVVAESIIFLPILYIANTRYDGVIQSAGIMTLAVFGGLTAAVLFTRRDYSFLGPIIAIGSFLALGLMVVAMLVGFNLGIFFMFAMVALACAAIIYQTSNVLHQFSPAQHVAAALALFASVAMLFWWILQIAMSANRN